MSLMTGSNQHAVARVLLNSPKVDRNFKDHLGRMPLEYSALQLSTPIVELLFNSEKIGPISQIIHLIGEDEEGQESAAEDHYVQARNRDIGPHTDNMRFRCYAC